MGYSDLKANALNKLNEARIGEDLQKRLNEAACQCSREGGEIAAAMLRQTIHGFLTNVPTGIQTVEEAQESSWQTGLVSWLGAKLQWDIIACLEFCGDLMEDVNAHDIAAMLRQKAKDF